MDKQTNSWTNTHDHRSHLKVNLNIQRDRNGIAENNFWMDTTSMFEWFWPATRMSTVVRKCPGHHQCHILLHCTKYLVSTTVSLSTHSPTGQDWTRSGLKWWLHNMNRVLWSTTIKVFGAETLCVSPNAIGWTDQLSLSSSVHLRTKGPFDKFINSIVFVFILIQWQL